MPDIADPRYFQQLARTLDRITAELPRAEQLRRGDDISPAIRTLISDLGFILTEISEELETSYRHEVYDRPAHGPAERYGTFALAQCAPSLGASLGHLGQVVERLGFLHQHVLQPANGPRTPIPASVREPLQGHLYQVAELVRAGAGQLRTASEELSRTRTARFTSGTPSAAAPDTPPRRRGSDTQPRLPQAPATAGHAGPAR
ncbi:hypothetical protein ACFY1L_36140 [Streptomyces sp. NPDC001663]|uniref:hypothetical protein n=1 Tax=Streptomyces sp. NPDC001663 TaxID=3364597 RepID=UPI003697A8DA